MHTSFIIPEKTVSFSGYRPHKIKLSDPDNPNPFAELQAKLLLAVHNFAERGYRIFLSGMAEGFDLMAARAVLLAQEKYPNIELIAIIPFPEQAERFKPYWQKEYNEILKNADSHITLSPRYYTGVYHRRNEFLTDHCSALVCYYDGQPGGTEYTVNMALKAKKEVVNLCSHVRKGPIVNPPNR